jgi:hypothetical protein
LRFENEDEISGLCSGLPTNTAAGDGYEQWGPPGSVRLPDDDNAMAALPAYHKSELDHIRNDGDAVDIGEHRFGNGRNLQLLELLQHLLRGLNGALFRAGICG